MQHRYTLADTRASTGVNGAIGMDLNRRLTPCSESIAARKADEMAANATACSVTKGVTYCPMLLATPELPPPTKWFHAMENGMQMPAVKATDAPIAVISSPLRNVGVMKRTVSTHHCVRVDGRGFSMLGSTLGVTVGT